MQVLGPGAVPSGAYFQTAMCHLAKRAFLIRYIALWPVHVQHLGTGNWKPGSSHKPVKGRALGNSKCALRDCEINTARMWRL